MSKIKIEPPTDEIGKWVYGLVCGTGEPIEIDIPGTGAVEDAQNRFAAIFELFDVLKEMNQNMVNINEGIAEMNENLKNLGMGDFDGDLEE